MNRLMFRWPLMAEADAGGEGGGGAGTGGTGGQGTGADAGGTGGEGTGTGGESAGTGGTGGTGGQGTGTDAGGTGGDAGGEGTGAGGEPKPFLGGGGSEPKPASDEDYANALKKDEALLGAEKEIQLDPELYKACVPVMRKYGVTPEAANALANALAKAQIDDAKARLKERVSYFEQMKQESLRKYTPRDFEQINAGIDKWFKPGGVMNQVIRNSELGADPEFLALMHFLGAAVAEDRGDGTANGAGGGSSADPNSTDGLSKMW